MSVALVAFECFDAGNEVISHITNGLGLIDSLRHCHSIFTGHEKRKVSITSFLVVREIDWEHRELFVGPSDMHKSHETLSRLQTMGLSGLPWEFGSSTNWVTPKLKKREKVTNLLLLFYRFSTENLTRLSMWEAMHIGLVWWKQIIWMGFNRDRSFSGLEKHSRDKDFQQNLTPWERLERLNDI